MRVLLVDSDQYFPASPLFVGALGPDDTFFNEAPYLAHPNKLRRLLGRRASAWVLNAALTRVARQQCPDVLLVVKGLAVRPETLRTIKAETGATLVNFATDDPFNRRVSSRELVASIREYDLYCCVRKAMIPDVLAAGCPRAEFVMCGYNPTTHFPPQTRFTPGFDVTMIGGADADRIPFARALTAASDDDEFNLSLFGGYWERDPICRRYAMGMLVGDQYRKALWLSKIAVCLIRRANRDDHAMKTFELPACGVFTLFERTPTHESLFGRIPEVARRIQVASRSGMDWMGGACTGPVRNGMAGEPGSSTPGSIFFSSPNELVDCVRYWLARDPERILVAEGECVAVRGAPNTWRDRYEQILALAQEIRAKRGRIDVRA